RRKVFRVVIVYWVVAWTLVEVADNAVPALRLPEWTNSLVMLMALLGFPLAVILAWAYEVTPGGVRRTEAEDPGPAEGTQRTHRPAVTPVPRMAATRRPPQERESPRLPSPESRPTAPPDPDQLRRAMLATLRHELRTPLNAVIGYGEILLEDSSGERCAPLRALLTAGRRILA